MDILLLYDDDKYNPFSELLGGRLNEKKKKKIFFLVKFICGRATQPKITKFEKFFFFFFTISSLMFYF